MFDLGPLEHARRFFVGPYADSVLPGWALWVAGTAVPLVELASGAAMLVGWRVREAALGMGAVLIIVTFGHLLSEPFFALDSHVMPRLLLLLFVLMGAPDRRSVVGGGLARGPRPTLTTL